MTNLWNLNQSFPSMDTTDALTFMMEDRKGGNITNKMLFIAESIIVSYINAISLPAHT